MRTDELLRIARDIINKVPSCMAITVDGNGDANARVVDPKTSCPTHGPCGLQLIDSRENRQRSSNRAD